MPLVRGDLFYGGTMCTRMLLVFALLILTAGGGTAWAGDNFGAGFSTWPDTGQTTCYDGAGTVIACPVEGKPFHGQDAQYQETGRARSYTSLSYGTSTGPIMVRDNVTGLTWEVKQNRDGFEDYTNPNDADNTYTWCDIFVGDQGTCGTNDTKDFIDALNSAKFGGYSDWRLPTLKELATLVDYSRFDPSIDYGVFPSTVSAGYWSSTTIESSTSSAWLVDFYGGNDDNDGTLSSYYVRAVRGGQ